MTTTFTIPTRLLANPRPCLISTCAAHRSSSARRSPRSSAAHFEQHGVGLSDGAMFGAKKGTHVRINLGCARATLTEALRRMKAASAAR